jgi:AcrR family transcriptional regulator
MSWSGRRGGRRSYHHGNLREALIEGVLDLIAEKGPAGLTIAEAARAAGVSSAAPYRHFRDREALLAEVARRGFEQFEAQLAGAWNRGQPDPITAFGRLGAAYLGFARAEPAYYAAMFEAGIPADTDPALRQAGDRAFGVVREAAEAVVALAPAASRPPALMVALHMWAMAHGIASLFGRGDPARRPLPMSAEDLLEAALLVYLRGVGLAGGPAPSSSPGGAATKPGAAGAKPRSGPWGRAPNSD